MLKEVSAGLLIPFAGTALGSACVFLLKKGLGEICLQVPILLINSKLTPEKYGLKFVDNVDNLF